MPDASGSSCAGNKPGSSCIGFGTGFLACLAFLIAAGLALPLAIVFLYFAAQHALGALFRMGVGLFVLVTVFATAVQWNGLMACQVAHTRRGTIRMRATDEALGYIQAHVPEGHKLLVHPYSPLYSFLSGTFSPKRFEYLQAGMHTPQQFQQTARELSLDPTAAVLLDLNFPATKLPSIWPATPAEAVARDAVSEYVLSNYRACAVLNAGVTDTAFVYMTRSDLECPR